ncbi:MAG: PAS domain S-box protein [Nitrospirae bacterium]|nr:PAS domain S-box protein [Nitrospirota bacterium]
MLVSEARYRSYVDMAGQFGWVTNPEGEVIEDIPSLRKFTGQTYEEAKGSGWANALHPDDVEHTMQLWNKAVATKSPYEVEYRMCRHDGVYRYLLARGFPAFREDGSIREWVGTCIDITERRQTEQELRLVKQRLELATRSASLGIWDWDITNNIMTWDDKMIELYGITWETFPGGVEAWFNGLHPEDRDRTIEENNAALRGEKEWDTDFRVLHPNGTVRHIKANGIVIRDSEGTPIRMLGTNYDITGRKRMEEQLLKSKEELELKVTERTKELLLINEQLKVFTRDKEMLLDELDEIFTLSSDMICIADINGYFRKINPAWEKTLGYTKEELLSKPYLYFVHPDDKDKTLAVGSNTLALGATVSNFENRFLCKDGTYRWLSWTSNPNPEKGITYAIARDITERKQVEVALQQSEEKFRTLFESSIDALFIIDMDGNLIDINKTAYERLGYMKEEMLSMSLYQLDHPDFRDKIPDRIAMIQKHGHAVFELAHMRKDGTSMPIEVNINLIDFQGRKVFFSIIRDITERKQSEEKLKKRERQLMESQRVAHLGNWDLNLVSQELEWSDEAYRLFDQSPGLFVPSFNEFARLVHPDDLVTMQTNFGKALDSDTTPYHVAVRIINDTGRQWVMEAFGVVRRDSSGKALSIFGTAQDITERRRYEEQIQQSLREKETLLRELYHRTKNNMQIITSILILQSRDIDDKKTLQILEDTRNRIHSMAMVHEKLYKAKNLSQVYLSDYIKDLVSALKESHNTEAEHISLDVNVDIIAVSIDTITPLGLILNELMTNALKYAFPDKREGWIVITARLKEDAIIELSFSDNGIGMPNNINIEETETLGLMLVRTLVAQIKGTLEIQTQNGTTFIITFNDKDTPARI